MRSLTPEIPSELNALVLHGGGTAPREVFWKSVVTLFSGHDDLGNPTGIQRAGPETLDVL